MGPGCRQERRASKRPQRWTCRDRRKMPLCVLGNRKTLQTHPYNPDPPKTVPGRVALLDLLNPRKDQGLRAHTRSDQRQSRIDGWSLPPPHVRSSRRGHLARSSMALVAATSCFLDISADLESDRMFSLILPIAGQCSEWSSTDVRSANHTAQRPRTLTKLASN
jgi:hypothetical protein